MNETKGHVVQSKGHTPHPILRVVIPVCVILASILVAVILVKTRSRPKPRPPQERVAVVDIQVLAKTNAQVTLRTTGTVAPSQAVTLQAQVAGPVLRLSPAFLPGGQVRAGERLLEIDPADYELAVTNRWAGLVKAEYDRQVEQGMQEVARHEWDAMQRMAGDTALSPLDRELALREPHLRLAMGNLVSARALLTQAQLNLARTQVTAPFNAVIRSRLVDVGSQVSVQTPLAELAGTDAYWVRVALPLSQAHWVSAADGSGGTGSCATVTSVPGLELQGKWTGHVLRRLPDLEAAGRQAQFIVEIPNPVQPAEGRGLLPLGAYVRVEIEGPALDGIFSIPRPALKDGTDVWIMGRDNRLEIRKVDVAWTSPDKALIRGGVSVGERLVASDISLPLKGMLLADAKAPPPPEDTSADKKKGKKR